MEDELTNFRILRYFLNKEGNIFFYLGQTQLRNLYSFGVCNYIKKKVLIQNSLCDFSV